MAVEQAAGALSPVMAFGLVGALGVGAQWLAWRLKMPAIVLMLVAGIIVGPVLGIFDPARDIGPLVAPMIAIAVAIILFEGGLTLSFHSLSGAGTGVKRLVFLGAPLGWISSALALRYGAGLSWESAAVFGGIMIVTGPTVIAPLLRTARLQRRPAALLQWEAIVNDPIGALCAVLAFQVVMVRQTGLEMGEMLRELGLGIGFATLVGLAAGWGISWAFKRGKVPEYMKVPVLFVTILAAFALSDTVLHESGLLAVTVMGIVIANRALPSYDELLRFKEHATILLVSGVFILLAAGLDFAALRALDWRAALFVAAVILLARPLTVLISLAFSDIPWPERLFVAFTGPRGVVLVAVAGLFGQRLVEIGIEDGAMVGPLAFLLVAVTVVLHGFTLAPLGRALGLASTARPGVLLVGGNPFTLALAQVLTKAEIPVVLTDPNHSHLRAARAAGMRTFTGDVLSEAAERRLDLGDFAIAVTATDNDPYNTLVASDLAHEVGRDNVYQITRDKADRPRHALPATLGGREFGGGQTLDEINRMLFKGWSLRMTKLTEEYGFADWRAAQTEAILLGVIGPGGGLRLLPEGAEIKGAGRRILALLPPDAGQSANARKARREGGA